jgi:uncharacterized protein YfaS (alpha-2-macroglobulin family)
MRLSRLPLVAAVLLLSFTLIDAQTLGLAPEPAPKTAEEKRAACDARIAEAKRYAAENSWALAREAYAAAVPLAPDAEARRWCELWVLDATWRANPQLLDDEQAELIASLEKLTAPYANVSGRDDFWAACMESIAAAKRAEAWSFRNEKSPWIDELIIADYLANQPTSPAAAARYVEFLLRLLAQKSEYLSPDSQQKEQFIHHLAQAARVVAEQDSRARLALLAADYASDNGLPAGRPASLYATALAAGRGTPRQSLTAAKEFLWRVKTGRLVPDAQGRPDLPSWLAELNRHIEASAGFSSSDPLQNSTRKELYGLRDTWTAQRLELRAADLFRPEEPLRFTVGSAYVSKIDFEIHRVQPENFQLLTIWNEDLPSLPVSRDLVTGWSMDLRADLAPYLWQSHVVKPPVPLAPGLYLLAARIDGGRYRVASFAVSAAAGSVVQTAPDRWEFFFHDSKTLQSIQTESARVGMQRRDAATSIEWMDIKPSNDGRFAVTVVERKVPMGVVMVKDFGPVIFDNLYGGHWRMENAEDDLHLDVFMPRELYRPGETVPFKLIGRHRREHRFVKPVGSLTLKAMLDETPVGDPVTITWDDDGAASGEIAIPRGTKPGRVRLMLTSGEDEIEERNFFRIDHFLTPPAVAKLELSGDRAGLRPGGEATFRVSARYFSGGPMVGAPVEMKFGAIFPYMGMQPDVGDDRRKQLEEWRKKQSEHVYTAATDAEGIAKFTLQLPDYVPPAFTVGASHVVKPAGLPELRGSEMLSASASGLWLEVDGGETQRAVAPGEKFTLRFRYLDAMDRPVTVSGWVSLVEDRWQEVWLDPEGNAVTGEALAEARRAFALVADAPLPAAWKKIHGETATKVIATEDPVAVGDGWATVSFTIPKAGVYHFDFNADTGPVESEKRYRHEFPADYRSLAVYAVDASTRTLALAPKTERLVGASEIVAGEKPRFVAILPEGIQSGWLVLSGETETRMQAFSSEGRVASVTFENPPAFSSSGWARLMTPASDPYYGAHALFAVKHPELNVRTDIATSAAEMRPGEKTELAVRTRDHEGRPVAMTVAVGVSDQAVNELLSPERTSVSGLVEYRQVVDMHSFSSQSWQKKHTTLRMADPRDGLRFYRSVTSGEEEVSLDELSVLESRFGGSLSAMGMADAALSFDGLIAGDDSLVQKPVRPEPSSTVLGQSAEAKPVVTVRRHFVSTAFWAPTVKTDANGEVRVAFTYPDNLTEWRLAAYAIGKDGNSFGTATTFVKTTLPFQARLSAPRFLVAGDSATVTATLVDRSGSDAKAEAAITVAGDAVRLTEGEPAIREALGILANGETRTGWSVQATQPGTAVMMLSAHTQTAGDAMEMSLPVIEDGIQQKTAASVRLRTGAKMAELALELPAPLDPARTDVRLTLSPSRAAAVLDALPYLIDYPYGCVEQTMSRFLPAVVVKKTLGDLGFDTAVIERRILARETAKQATRREKTAGFAELDEVVAQSLARLVAAQDSDGSFGWWPGQQNADLWMTAYVAWGLALADEAGIEIPEKLVEETNEALGALLKDEKRLDDTTAWALAAAVRALGNEMEAKEVGEAKTLFTRLYDGREKLSASGRACLLLAAKVCATEAQSAVLLRNLESGAVRVVSGDFGDTVHWGSTRGYWRASEGSVETTALTLLALLETQPEHALIEPAVNWLVLNRGSGGWSNTRDTAFAVLALSRFLAVSREAEPDAAVEVVANGKTVKRVTLDRAALLEGPVVSLEVSLLKAGKNKVELRRVGGRSPVYGLALVSAWATGDAVKPAGHLLEAARAFDRQKARATLAGTLYFTPEPQPVNGIAAAGEQVVARVALNMPNDLEYVMVEVPKPAGCEPLNPLSGWDARLVRIGNAGTALATGVSGEDAGMPIYREEHDDRSVFFIDALHAGSWEIRFGLRAVHPGEYRALPVHAEAMYVPEVRANSDARRLRIGK